MNTFWTLTQMKLSPLLAIGMALLIHLFPSRLNAEIAVVESAEWVIATSDHIVVGTVVGIEKVPVPNHDPSYVITVVITRTLKGQPAARTTFPLPRHHTDEAAKQWLDEKKPLLFCLVGNDGKRQEFPPEKFPWLLRHNTPQSTFVFTLNDAGKPWPAASPVCTRDDRVLTREPEILQFFETTISQTEKSRPALSHKIIASPRISKRNWAGSMVFMILPVDEKLESLGQALCLSTNADTRYEGAKILQYFKSEKNIALLNSLLADPATSEFAQSRTSPSGENQFVWRKKVYLVRIAAFNSLARLGVQTAPPTFEILLEGQSSTPFVPHDIGIDALPQTQPAALMEQPPAAHFSAHAFPSDK